MPGEVEPDDPWSREVPVADAPVEFTFPSVTPASDGDGTAPRVDGAPTGASAPADEHRSATPPRDRRRAWIGAAAVAVLGVLGIVAVWDGGGSDDADTDEATVTTTLTSAAPSTTAAPRPTTTVSSTASSSAPPTTGVELPPTLTWWDSTQPVLPEFAAMAPAPELVVLTRTGVLAEVDLATGDTRTLDLDRPAFGVRVDVSRSASLLASSGGLSFRPMIVPSGGEPIELGLDEYDGFWAFPSALDIDDFFVDAWSMEDNSGVTLRIGPDGSVEETRLDVDGRFTSAPLPGRRQLVVDAGGLYLVDADGTTGRLSPGALNAHSANTVLVKECDEQRVCDRWVIDIASGDRRPAVVPDEIALDGYRGPVAMSPDGGHLAAVTFSRGGSVTQFVDLADGSIVGVDLEVLTDSTGGEIAWAPDSSGIFAIDGGQVVFADRTTGRVTEVPIEVDADTDVDVIVDLGIRTAV